MKRIIYCSGQYFQTGPENAISNIYIYAESSAHDTFNYAKKSKIGALYEEIFQK